MSDATDFRPTSILPALVIALSLATAGAASAQPQRTFKVGGPDELWDMTMKMEMPGMPMAMPAQTHQVCMKKNRKPEDAVPVSDECRLVDSKTVGNKTTFTMDCAGKDPMTVRGEITTTASGYDGTMRMKGKRKGEDMEVTQVFSGKKVGACTDQSEQMVAAAKAQGDAATAAACSEGLDKLVPQYFFGASAPCTSRQKEFCARVGTYARDMREPAAFKAAVAKSNAQGLKAAFDACNQDFGATAKAACGKAVSTRDWPFVGSGNCDAEVLAAGGTQCKGRDYYTMDRTLTPMCNRYAMLMRGSGAAAGAGAAPTQKSASNAPPPTPAEEPRPDAMKQGLDAIRKVLPF